MPRSTALRGLAAALVCVVCALAQAEYRQSPGYAAYQRGNALFVERKFPESMAALEAALQLDPKLVPALTLKAKLAMAENRFDLARQSLDRALAVDPKSASAEFLYGLQAYMENDLHNALPHFRKAHQLNRADAHAALYLAMTRESLGQTAEAVEDYQEAVRLEHLAGTPQATTLLAGARLLLVLERGEEGERWIAEALKVDPGSRDGHFEWARLLLKKGEAARAAKEGEVALALHGGDATDAQIHYLLVRAYLQSGDPARSRRHAEIVRALDGQ